MPTTGRIPELPRRAAAPLLLVLLLVPRGIRAQEMPAVRAGLSGTFQFLFSTSSIDEEDVPGLEVAPTSFETRRIRIAADVVVGDWIRVRIEPDFAADAVSLKDAFADLELDAALSIRLGQFKKPFSLIRLTPAPTVPVIERAVSVRGLDELLEREIGAALPGDPMAILDRLGYEGRDLGVMVGGRAGGLGWSAAVFNGAGANRPEDNAAKSFAGRVDYTVTPGLVLSAAASHREVGTGDEAVSGTAWEGAVEWGGFRKGGPWVMVQATTGDRLAGSARFSGVEAMATWFHPLAGSRFDGVEPLLRAGWGDPDDTRDRDAGVLLTPGLNLYVFGQNRLMVNWDVYLAAAGEVGAVSSLKVEAQLHW